VVWRSLGSLPLSKIRERIRRIILMGVKGIGYERTKWRVMSWNRAQFNHVESFGLRIRR
jgi:hypothetical protein